MAKRGSAKLSDQGAALKKEGAKWIDRIESAWKREDAWAKDAELAVKAYTNESAGQGKLYDYNILHANVETIVPAIINSPPVPDIRRRFGDADPVAKQLSDIVERAITVQVDDSRLAVELEGQAQDAFLAGRGVVRLRFHADTQETDTSALEEAEDAAEDDKPEASGDGRGSGELSDIYADPTLGTGSGVSGGEGEVLGGPVQVSNERCTFEAVSWRDYQHGPAKRWEDRPWESFRHVMQCEDVTGFADDTLVTAQTEPGGKAFGDAADDITLYEIWDKAKREVIFVSDNGKVLKKLPDPLGLTNFFPSSRPVQPIEIVGRLMPVTPFSIYMRLADELDIITKRIRVITNAMKIKGAFIGGIGADLKLWSEADDNELIALSGIEALAQMGGVDKAITWWPVEKFQPVLAELFKNRDLTKQAIFEITGISDIVRGASKASETLGAQQIKSQWGALRIQKMQRMMERSARDLFVMMSEIIPAKFSHRTLEAMTGIPITIQPTDTPEQIHAKQQLHALMQQKLTTSYRVDVESESTVRADLTMKKQEAAEFLNGSAAYFAAVGPLVADGTLPAEAALEIYASNARLFNLGKSVEDTIEQMVQEAKKRVEAEKQNPTPKPPTPEEIKAQADAAKLQADQQAQQQKAQIDGMKAQMDGQKAQSDAQIAQAQLQLDQAVAAAEAKLAQAQLAAEVRQAEMKDAADRFKAQLDAVTKIKVAMIAAQTDLERTSLEAELEAMLGLQTSASQATITAMQHDHERTMQREAPKPKLNGKAN